MSCRTALVLLAWVLTGTAQAREIPPPAYQVAAQRAGIADTELGRPAEKDAHEDTSAETGARRSMGRDEAQEIYNTAMQAYDNGAFAEALRLLDVVREAFPKHRNLLYNQAKCLVALGRKTEARALCDHLIAVRQYAPAIELRNSIGD